MAIQSNFNGSNTFGTMEISSDLALMIRFYNIVFSEPEMLPMYFITCTYYSDGKIKWNGIVHHLYIKFIREII